MMNLFATATQTTEAATEAGKELTLNLDPSVLANYGPVAAIAVLAIATVFQFRKKEGGGKFFGTMLTLAILSLVGYGGSRIHNGSDFDARVNDHVLAAYNAETPQEAKLQYDRAVKVMRDRGMTQGSTAYLYPSPEYNVGDWFSHIEKAEKELTALADSKAEDNKPKSWQDILVENKVVTTKMGADEQVIPEFHAPSGISVHPNTQEYALWFWGSVLSALVFGTGFVMKTRKNW